MQVRRLANTAKHVLANVPSDEAFRLDRGPVQKSRTRVPLFPLPSREQFRHVLRAFLRGRTSERILWPNPRIDSTVSGICKVKPYWTTLSCMAKGRWLGRGILDVMSDEFRSRSLDFYVRDSHRVAGKLKGIY